VKIINCSDQGHSRLSADRAHTTSYSPFVVTMRLYRTVIEILSLLVESRKFFIIVYLAVPVEGNRIGILPRTLTSKIKVPGLLSSFLCVILRLAIFVELRFVTHRRTQGHSIYRASTTSRGKTLRKIVEMMQNVRNINR